MGLCVNRGAGFKWGFVVGSDSWVCVCLSLQEMNQRKNSKEIEKQSYEMQLSGVTIGS